jgi:hypothetical protein
LVGVLCFLGLSPNVIVGLGLFALPICFLIGLAISIDRRY